MLLVGFFSSSKEESGLHDKIMIIVVPKACDCS